jgi:hypothetical protein
MGIAILLLGVGAFAAYALSQQNSLRKRTIQKDEAALRIEEGEASADDYELMAQEAANEGDIAATEEFLALAEEAPEAVEDVPPARLNGEVESPQPILPPELPESVEDLPIEGVNGEEEVQEILEEEVPETVAEVESEVPVQTVTVQPSEEISEGPPGFDPFRAVEIAPTVATNIATEEHYDRNLLKEFQKAAGIAVDGLYGGGSRAALQFYGIENARRPHYRPIQGVYPSDLADLAIAMGAVEV